MQNNNNTRSITVKSNRSATCQSHGYRKDKIIGPGIPLLDTYKQGYSKCNLKLPHMS